jgi:hypothetical protein
MTSSPMNVRIAGNTLQMGALTITFHRTLRIPDNGRQYPAAAFAGRVPAAPRGGLQGPRTRELA